jgi:hypothetical protein
LGHALVLSAVAVALFTAFVLVGLGGWGYYTTPVAVRGYARAHRLLRPAGRAGHLFGVGGFVLMLVPVAYSVRKKLKRFRDAGSIKTWLEVHVFCGIVGPVLVTFHTSFKFNGIVSVAYWSMVAVVLSGFVGRYLYVRIPRSIRGQELTQVELDARAAALARQIAEAQLPERLLTRIDELEHQVVPATGQPLSFVALLTGEVRMRRALARFRGEVSTDDTAPALHREAIDLIAERATLLRRTAYLKKTKKLFDLWHVFHMPLVYVMFGIVIMHVAVTMYMGYVPFRD